MGTVTGRVTATVTLLLLLLLRLPQSATAQTIDTFDDVAAWVAAPASGVELELRSGEGHTGKALEVSFDFHGQGGWAAFRRQVQLNLADNYEISFWLKGDAPTNTLEFKLVDPSGENVWWVNRREFEFAGPWRKITFRKRHVKFAWGPVGGGDIRNVGAVEFAITAGTGGKGTIWIDDLAIRALEPVRPYDATPVVTSAGNTRTIDFTRNREYGGIIVDWRPGPSRTYDVQTSMDGRAWQTVRTVRGGMRERDYLQLPETESRYVRLNLHSSARLADLRDVRVMPLEWGENRNKLFETIAMDAPKGTYPEHLRGVMSYWTVIGLNGDESEAMMSEDGAVEVDKRAFSVEPFLYADGKLITWSDARVSQSLVDGDLPIPTVTWEAAGLKLEVTSWRDTNALILRYRVTNTSTTSPSLYLALRPFQVNPSTQFLNTAGGATTLRAIRQETDGRITVDDNRQIVPFAKPLAFGTAKFDQGDIVDFIRNNAVPLIGSGLTVIDTMAAASAALSFPVAPATTTDIYVAVVAPGDSVPRDPAASFENAVRYWRTELGDFSLKVPDPRIGPTIRSNLAYILINRDRAAIQPGSRSYERSWIRDGSLTSAALLRLGHAKEVREFIEWYAPFQYKDGKVPCCVDRQGAGPVPENDSHGQLIYVIAEYFRFTGDTALVRRLWPHVAGAVTYMDSLRNSRRTAEYRNTPFFGLMPQSISHEGYSAKPMHSYWDDFFALKGFKDAAWLAEIVNDNTPRRPDVMTPRRNWSRMRDEFRTDLMQSFRGAMQEKGIDYLPGSVELGDFDATSTTVGVNPAGAKRDLPQAALKRTFDKYWENFVARRDTANWDAYTPYEWRVVGTFVRLGEKQRAHAIADWFFQHVRPEPWNHWAEVVFRDRDALRFIGDMPHTWVGSDFIRSILDMFFYEEDDSLVLAAGITPEWLNDAQGVAINNVHTPYGKLGYEMRRDGRAVTMRFTGAPRPPANGFVVKSPLDETLRAARADGRVVEVRNGEIGLKTLPRELILSY